MSRAAIGRMIALPAFHWNFVFYDLYSNDPVARQSSIDRIDIAERFTTRKTRFAAVIDPEIDGVSFFSTMREANNDYARSTMEKKLHADGHTCTVRGDLVILVADQVEADLIALNYPGAVMAISKNAENEA